MGDKISGCNHMTCPRCKQEWCWMCGDGIDSVGAHFRADNPKGCRQFAEQSTPLRETDALVFFCCVIIVLGFLLMGAFWCFHLNLQKWARAALPTKDLVLASITLHPVIWMLAFYCVC